MLDLDRLDALREALVHDEDLDAVARRFLDDFGDDPDFVSRGFPTEEPLLEQLVRDVVRRAIGLSSDRAEFFLHRVAPTPFVHGAVVFGRRPATLLWFEDVGVGLVTILSEKGADHIRFRAVLA